MKCLGSYAAGFDSRLLNIPVRHIALLFQIFNHAQSNYQRLLARGVCIAVRVFCKIAGAECIVGKTLDNIVCSHEIHAVIRPSRDIRIIDEQSGAGVIKREIIVGFKRPAGEIPSFEYTRQRGCGCFAVEDCF